MDGRWQYKFISFGYNIEQVDKINRMIYNINRMNTRIFYEEQERIF